MSGTISKSARTDRIGELLNLHEVLEIEHNDGERGNFLFGWQCENSFAADLLEATKERAASLSHTQYSYLEEDSELAQKISKTHTALDGIVPSAVFCGAGATAILFAFAAYLRKRNIAEVYFVPPLYFSLHFAFRLFGIRARAVSRRHAFEPNFKANLPTRETVLFLTDPVWYAGRAIPSEFISEISEWQKKTSSIVFVDGSFQYMPWEETIQEATAALDANRTVRLISPTKSLAVHGYRFAYAFMPSAWRSEFSHTYTNIYGSATTDAIAFGHEAINALYERALTKKLIGLARERHTRLRLDNKIQSHIDPTCGYFVFEELNVPLPIGYVRMGGEFFDQPRYPGYLRLNLLSPSFHLLK